MAHVSLAASVLLISCVAGQAFAQQGLAVSDQAAREAAETMSKQFITEYNSGNSAGVASLFAQGGVFLTPGGTVLTGEQQIEKGLAGRIKAGWTKETAKITEVHPAGDAVWSTGEFMMEGTGPNSGKEIGGYYAEVLTREGSDWRLRMLIGNLKPTQDVTGVAAAIAK